MSIQEFLAEWQLQQTSTAALQASLRKALGEPSGEILKNAPPVLVFRSYLINPYSPAADELKDAGFTEVLGKDGWKTFTLGQ